MRCYRKTLHISYKKTYEVRAKVKKAIRSRENLLTIVKRRQLQWYGHVSRSSGLAKNHLAGHSERGKTTRQTEEEVGTHHQGMDRPGVRQVPEGSREQREMEKTDREVIYGAPTTLAVQGQVKVIGEGGGRDTSP